MSVAAFMIREVRIAGDKVYSSTSRRRRTSSSHFFRTAADVQENNIIVFPFISSIT